MAAKFSALERIMFEGAEHDVVRSSQFANYMLVTQGKGWHFPVVSLHTSAQTALKLMTDHVELGYMSQLWRAGSYDPLLASHAKM